MSNWTPELRKQHRKMLTDWKTSSRLTPEEQVARYMAWRAERGITTPVALFPQEGHWARSPNRARYALNTDWPLQATIDVDLEDYT